LVSFWLHYIPSVFNFGALACPLRKVCTNEH